MSRRRTETETVPEKENDRKEKDKKEKTDKRFSSTLSRVLGSRTRSLSRQGSSHELREKSTSLREQSNEEASDLKDSLRKQTEKVESMTRKQESLAALEEKLANERRELANGRVEMESQLAQRDIILKEMVRQVEEKERERQQMANELEATKTEKEVLEGAYVTVKGQKEARPDLEKHVVTLTRQKMELERFREMLEKRVENLTSLLHQANREKAAQLTELEAERATLEKWKAKISAALKMKLEEAQKNCEHLEADKEEAERDVARLVKVNKELEDKVVVLEADLKSSGEKLDVLVQRVEKDEMTKRDMEEEMRKLQAELQEIRRIRVELVTDGKKAEKEASIAKTALEAAKTQRDKVQTDTNTYLETMRVEILALKEEADKAVAAATAASKMKERATLKRIKSLEGELELAISEKEANKTDYDVQTAALEKKVRELTEKLAESTKENLQLAGVAEEQQTQVTTMLSEMAKSNEGENQRLSDGRTIEVLKATIARLDSERKASEKKRDEQIAMLEKQLNGAHIEKEKISTEMKQMAQRRDEESQEGEERSHAYAFLDERQDELGPEIKESELSQELKEKTQELQLIRGERDSLKLKLEIMEQKEKMIQSIFPWCSCINRGEE